MSAAASRTLYLLNLVVNPRPKIHLRSEPAASIRTKRSVRKLKTKATASNFPVGLQSDAFSKASLLQDNACQTIVASQCTAQLGPTQPKALRSYRRMKHRSVSDTVVSRPQPFLREPSDTPLRVGKRSVSWPQSTIGACKTPLPFNLGTSGCVHSNVPSIPSNLDPAEYDSDECSICSGYVTAQSSFFEGNVTKAESILQVLDSAPAIALDSSLDLAALSYSSGPLMGGSSYDILSRSHCNMSNSTFSPGPALPRLKITCPTPVEPSSPVFISQSPITFSKFVSASTSVTSPRLRTPTRGSPIPALPQCRSCGLAEFGSGSQCRECDAQWLACKVWYQASDGGRKRYLMEPFIKPAESNARNRAMLNVLGVPGGSPSSYGLGIQFQTLGENTNRFQRAYRRMLKFKLSNVFQGPPENLGQNDLDAHHSSVPSGLRALVSTKPLGRLWQTLQYLVDPPSTRDDPIVPTTTNSSSTEDICSSILVESTGAEASGIYGEACLPISPASPQLHNSRFIEHLTGPIGYIATHSSLLYT
ncbi:hypothetical protein C8Q75DRAFT_811170 [Abortiporus biennis]|nr:hypothetical protein C8Q75DRAFT_811170 [Abortiporus biennis]